MFWSTNSGSSVPASDLLNFAEVAAQAAAMVALVFLDWRLGHTGRMGVALVAAASALQFAGGWLLFAPHFLEGFGFPGLAVLGAVFRGSGSAVLLLGLGRFLCSVKPEKSALAIGGGYAVFGLVSLALSHAPGDAIALASLASPFVSGLFLVLCGRNVRVARRRAAAIETSLLRRVPLDIVSLLLLCALAGVVSDAFAPSNIVDPKVFNVVWAVIYLVVFLVYCVWVFGLRRNDPDALWPFLVLIIFSGLLFYSSFSAINLEFAAQLHERHPPDAHAFLLGVHGGPRSIGSTCPSACSSGRETCFSRSSPLWWATLSRFRTLALTVSERPLSTLQPRLSWR